MKNIFSIFFFSFFSFTSFSQQGNFYITGKVIQEDSRLPMQAASVFAQNTTLGTATDAEGNFKLLLPNGGYDLIVTFTGFNAESRRISFANGSEQNVIIELKQKEKELAAVSIVSSGELKDGWEKYGSFFLEQFIGKTDNSAYCTIKNKDALKFFFSKKRNRLKVTASEPLIIENDALGYNIKYTLDSFTHEYSAQVSLYTGYPLFEEKTAASPEQYTKWKAARQLAYRGSVLHFMRSVYNQQLKEEGFEIQYVVKVNEMDSALKLKNFYTALNLAKDDSLHTVAIRPNQMQLGIIYAKEKPAAGFLKENPNEPSGFQFSTLTFLPGHSIIIEENGFYYEQNEITTNAYWTWDRIADQLPYDYNAY